MTAYPAWTPASRPGIIPLHPLTFGTILGRSFSALRANPRVLLGFALVVQTLGYLVVSAALAAIGVSTFSRLDTVPQNSDAFQQILAGSIAITAISAFVLGLAAGALGVIIQGIVVTEVAHAVVAERLPLRALWRELRPVAWRLLGYAFLLSAALVVLFALVGGAILALGIAAPVVGIVLALLSILPAIALVLWLSAKLLLAPAAIILERATIRGAIARSWRLTRGRFWSTLGVLVLVQAIFGALAQAVAIPFSILSSLLASVIAPTGDSGTTSIVTTVVSLGITQIVSLLVQSVGLVVQSTASGLIYIDCRMRHEGLDLDLLTYVERRDAGESGLADPYTEGIGRAFARPVPPPAYGYPPGAPAPHPGYPQPGYPQPAYPQPGYAQPAYPQPGYPPQYPAQPGYPPQYAAQPGYPQPSPSPSRPGSYPQPGSSPQPRAPEPDAAIDPAPPAPHPAADEPSPTTWTAPGAAPERESQ